MNSNVPASPKELIAHWLAGELEPAGLERLLQLCREDAALREEAARLKALERLLRFANLEGDERAFMDEVAVRCGVTHAGVDLENAVRWRVHWHRWAALAAAACIVAGIGVWGWLWSRPVARIESLTSVRWAEGQSSAGVEDRLYRGRFAIAEGYVELIFSKGAKLLVEGPAELDLRSSSLVHIQSGNAFAHVPPEAIGFTIEGPTGRVVDKGTDFAVHVGSSAMEVHVVKGLVEAGHGASLKSLRANEALEISAKSVNEIPADPGRFLAYVPPVSRKRIGWVHWAFDEGEGETTRPEGWGLKEAYEPAELTSLHHVSAGPQWTTGQFGSALFFDGEDDYVQSEFPGIAGNSPRTVAFWVKVPTNFLVKNGYALVCWGSTTEEGDAWQISVNPKAEAGALGRLRVGRIGEPIIGSTDLRDDRWHHVAVVFYGGNHSDGATQVLMYIDGQLERTQRKSVPIVHTATQGPGSRKVAFGLNIGPMSPRLGKPPEWLVFRGCMDEVFICDAALSQAQVRELIARNHTDAFAAGER